MKCTKYVMMATGAALVVLLGAAASDEGTGQYKLGGAWIANDGNGVFLNHVQIPLDPAGKTAALQVQTLSYGQAFADLVTLLGGDQGSDFVGQIAMTGLDTAKATIVAQLQKSGNPKVIKAVVVVVSDFRFTGPDTMVADYTIAFYPPSTDGLPHGEPMIGPLPAPTLTFKRVPLL